jgi:hypothetical protein
MNAFVRAGANFAEPASVVVNGAECVLDRPIAATELVCLLPPGAGAQPSDVPAFRRLDR